MISQFLLLILESRVIFLPIEMVEKGEDDIYSFALIQNKKRILYVRTMEVIER